MLQIKHRTLLVSNDFFILGLLQGYCAANRITLDETSSCKALQAEKFITDFQLVIFDIRNQSATAIESTLDCLYQIHTEFHIPVCIVGNVGHKQLIQTRNWVDCFFDAPSIEQIDSYFKHHFNHIFQPSLDRRYADRRQIDRRAINSRNPFSTTSQKPIPLSIVSNNVFKSESNKNILKLGPFEIDNNYKSVSLEGKSLNLSGKEYKLFNLLASDIDHIFSTTEIIQTLWEKSSRANKSDLYQYMHLLRKKVEIDPYAPQWVLTIKGVGYKLNVIPCQTNSIHSESEQHADKQIISANQS